MSEDLLDALDRCPECGEEVIYDTQSAGDVALVKCPDPDCGWHETEAVGG